MKPLRPAALLQQSPQQVKPRFGLMPTPTLLKMFDFATVGTSTELMSRYIYSGTISSRVIAARTHNERWENLRRDSAGWYFWYMGKPLMENFLIKFVVPDYARQHLMLPLLPNKTPFLKKMAVWAFTPTRVLKIASDTQLQQRHEQLIKAFTQAGKPPKMIQDLANQFEKVRMIKTVITTLGILFTLFALGIGIIQLNIMITRANVLNRRHRHAEPIVHVPIEHTPELHKYDYPTINPPLLLPLPPWRPGLTYIQPFGQSASPFLNRQ